MTMLEVNEAAMLIQKSTHDDANIIFGSVINDNMEGQMRVTVIATGFESKAETEQPVQKLEKKMPDTMEAEPMRKAVGDDGYRHLRGLAHEIKEDNPDSLNSSTNFDIPTFLRKHAD
jgi:cell division protein FtsZ